MMATILPFPSHRTRGPVHQARVLAGYLDLDHWRRWCARHGMIVEGEGPDGTARLPWPEERAHTHREDTP